MTMRIGIGISPDSVCAVMARDRHVEWSGIDNIDEDGLDAALTRVIGKLPVIPWPKPRVHAGVSASHAYIKTIHSLPLTRDARTLDRIVAASPSRFFVLQSGTATVTGVRMLEDGAARAAIVNNDVVAVLQAVCSGKGLTVARVVPGEIALSCLTDDELEDPCALGLGAIRLDRREPIVIRPRRVAMPERTVGVPRIALAAAVAVIAVMSALALPTFVQRVHASTAQQEIATLGPARARALTGERRLTEAARMLAAASEFERGRTSVTWLLRQLVNALPANAAIVSLRMDSAAVTLSALANHATDVVRGIQDMPGASNVEITGPITFENAAAGSNAAVGQGVTGAGLERVTVRFRLAPDPADLRTPLVSEREGKK
jgi:Tfp pilus assembly protein FimT